MTESLPKLPTRTVPFVSATTAPVPNTAWHPKLQRHVVVDGAELAGRTPPGTENFLLVLGGTFDLFAGGGAWLQRGRRQDVFERAERPVGVFLPPNTPWSAKGGHDLLVFSVRQPDEPKSPEPEEKAASKPLLQIAGSGKAFDSATQSWKPKEAFLSSPEAILPRRIERNAPTEGVEVRTILAADYKTLGLALDEAVCDAGSTWTPAKPTIPSMSYPAEWIGFVRSTGRVEIDGVVCDGGDHVVTGGAEAPTVRAIDAPAYIALAWAGSKVG